jgi:gustatory receptor
MDIYLCFEDMRAEYASNKVFSLSFSSSKYHSVSFQHRSCQDLKYIEQLKMTWKFNLKNPFKEFLNPTDIYTAQRPLLKLSLVSGIIPFKIANDGDSRLRISVFGIMVLILHLSVFGFCFVKTITVHESIVSYFFRTEISVLGDTLQLCIGLVGIITVFLYSLIQRHKFVLWFHLMARIDEHLKEIGIETDYRSTLKFIFLVLLVKFIFFNTYLIGSYVLFKIAGLYPNYTCWIVFFMPHIFISIIVVLFICLVKQMKHRFLLLNKVSLFDAIKICLW